MYRYISSIVSIATGDRERAGLGAPLPEAPAAEGGPTHIYIPNLCMYTCVYIYIYIHIHMYVYMYICIYVYM